MLGVLGIIIMLMGIMILGMSLGIMPGIKQVLMMQE